MKCVIGKREPGRGQISYRNARVTNEGQRQQRDLIDAVLFRNLPITLGAPSVAIANDAPADGECKPNEFTNTRHYLASIRIVFPRAVPRLTAPLRTVTLAAGDDHFMAQFISVESAPCIAPCLAARSFPLPAWEGSEAPAHGAANGYAIHREPPIAAVPSLQTVPAHRCGS